MQTKPSKVNEHLSPLASRPPDIPALTWPVMSLGVDADRMSYQLGRDRYCHSPNSGGDRWDSIWTQEISDCCTIRSR